MNNKRYCPDNVKCVKGIACHDSCIELYKKEKKLNNHNNIKKIETNCFDYVINKVKSLF